MEIKDFIYEEIRRQEIYHPENLRAIIDEYLIDYLKLEKIQDIGDFDKVMADKKPSYIAEHCHEMDFTDKYFMKSMDDEYWSFNDLFQAADCSDLVYWIFNFGSSEYNKHCKPFEKVREEE